MNGKFIGVTLIAISLLVFGFIQIQPQTEENIALLKSSELRAALIDSLYVSSPNNQFISNFKSILREVGFKVDIYRGREVTVDVLKVIPEDYNLLVLRMHSAVHSKILGLYLFTAEPYNPDKHVEEQCFHFVKSAVAFNESQPVFAVNKWFIKKCMAGKFNGTLLILMGCDGTCDPGMAKEFIRQGASGYIGWNGSVVPLHSDQAILQLIDNLYVKNCTVQEAVERTIEQVRSDPEYNSTLKLILP